MCLSGWCPCHATHPSESPKTPLADFYRRVLVVHLPGGCTCHAFLHPRGPGAACRLLSWRLYDTFPGKGFCHVSLNQHTFGSSGNLLTAHSYFVFLRMVPLPRLPSIRIAHAASSYYQGIEVEYLLREFPSHASLYPKRLRRPLPCPTVAPR